MSTLNFAPPSLPVSKQLQSLLINTAKTPFLQKKPRPPALQSQLTFETRVIVQRKGVIIL